MTKEFFKVTDLNKVLEYRRIFSEVTAEEVDISQTHGRILAENIISDADLPDFMRATMDGYAIRASSSYGATEANPAWLQVKGAIAMGDIPSCHIGPGEAARIATGGMLPQGADSVMMLEYTEIVDEHSVEIYKSIAPGQHLIEIGEDFRQGEVLLSCGQKIRAQETGLLAAFGKQNVRVYKKPKIAIISTGDEIVPIDHTPGPGKIRDINTYTLAGLVKEAGAIPLSYGIVPDMYETLDQTCRQAVKESDMVLISGGSSVGVRDLTIDVLSSLPDTEILVHGISISPGKPTILANVGNCAFWGLPGHVVSAMVVFSVVVKPFIEHISGLVFSREFKIPATLTRNVASVHGRTDYVRVRLLEKDGKLYAEPILGKSGLINTMVKADGLVEIDMNTEGLYQGANVWVIPV
jgi:molybdopterin molybdotransferase